MKDTIKSLVASIKESDKRRTSAYDTAATVRRIEDGVAWVHIPGGVDETPVKLTINAAVGDTVQVRVSGGRAFLVGNASAPPTDDKVATKALTETRAVSKDLQIVEKVATSAKQTAASAQEVAETGKAIAEATNQYFWYDDNGAHVTTVPQDTDPTGTTGFNTLWNALGLLLRNSATILAQFAQDAISFYDGDGNDAENVSASFGKTGAFIGGVGNNRLELNGLGLTGYDENNSQAFRIQYANANGTTDVIEKTPTVANPSGLDPTTFPSQAIIPKATVADLTNIYYVMTVTMKCNGNSKQITLRSSRHYDKSDSTLRTVTSNVNFPVNGSRYVLSCSTSFQTSSPASSIGSWDLSGYRGSIMSVQIDTYLTAETSSVPSYTFGTRSNDPLDNGAYSFTTGEGLIAPTEDQTVVGRYNVEDTNDEYALIIGNGTDDSNRSNAFTVDWNGNTKASGKLTAGAVETITPTWESGQEPANYHCVVSAGICSLFYQGQGVAHSANTVLFTLPAGARPVSSVIVPFVKMTGGAVGVIGIATDGTVKVNQITNTSSTGRIYFNCSFPVV